MVTVISLFAGVGGSSTGYEKAGFDVVLANEFDERIAGVYRANHPGTTCLVKPIQELRESDLRECDVLDGSPPCQGFTLTGRRKMDDGRNTLWLEYFRILDLVSPSVVLMENSSGIVKGYGKHYVRAILGELKRRGFKTSYRLINAAFYGVPQNRLRFIAIGQKQARYRWPERQTVITVREAFRDLPEGDIYYLDRYGHYSNSHKLLFNLKPGQSGNRITGRKYFNWARLHYDQPSRTLCAGAVGRGMIIHPGLNRPISVNETKRIGSFPDDYLFDDYYWAGYGIGNSVPPALIHTLARNFDV